MPAAQSLGAMQNAKMALQTVAEEPAEPAEPSEPGPSTPLPSSRDYIISLQAEISRLNAEVADLQASVNQYRDYYANLVFGNERLQSAAQDNTRDLRAVVEQAQNELKDYKQGINTLAEAITKGVTEEVAGLKAMLEAQKEQYVAGKATASAAKEKKGGLRQLMVGCFKG